MVVVCCCSLFAHYHSFFFVSVCVPPSIFGHTKTVAVRLFTHGYNLYAPSETVCYHLWSRDHRPTTFIKHDNNLHDLQKQASQNKVMKQLLGDPAVLGMPMGLGTERTVQEFEECLRVKFSTKSLREGYQLGELTDADFADNNNNISDNNSDIDQMTTTTTVTGAISSTIHPPHDDTIEARVSTLDSQAQNLIASFLRAMK
jgi:hypothetical protein